MVFGGQQNSLAKMGLGNVGKPSAKRKSDLKSHPIRTSGQNLIHDKGDNILR